MKIRRTRVAIVCFAIVTATTGTARAQALDTLHVRSFGMTADTLTPNVGQTFRLTISAHVDEQIAQIDNVTLPDLSAFDSQGDERRCTATAKGTDCTETLDLVPKVRGAVAIQSAVMEVVDASDNKPSRYATNSLRLQIGAAPFAFPTNTYMTDVLWGTLRGFLALLAAAVVIWYALYRFSRPRASRVVVEEPLQPVPVAVRPMDDFDERYRKLVDALRAEPTRARALAVRHALRYALAAQEEETLADLVKRSAAGDRPQRIAALRAIERASFCEDANVATNVREALPFLTI